MSLDSNPSVKVPQSDFSRQGTHILIAEDHTATRIGLARFLERAGYVVDAVGDGISAIEILGSPERPAIALIDWNLPSASGIEICKAAREYKDAPYVYVIMLTGRTEESDVAEALEAGADDFLRKPCGAVELIARIHNGERILRLERGLAARIEELQQASAHISQLHELLPVCMYCRKVRDDNDYWQALEAYFQEHTRTRFSHGVCPDCEKIMEMKGILPGFRDPDQPPRAP